MRYACEPTKNYVDTDELEYRRALTYPETERGYTYATVADFLHIPERKLRNTLAELHEEELIAA